MLLYKEKEFALGELVEYLNKLETKSIVLDLKFGEKPVIVEYNIDDNNVSNIRIIEEEGERFPESEYLYTYLTYKNISEKIFTAKICGWKEISYLNLINMILDDEQFELAFQIVSEETMQEDEELYEIENMEIFKELQLYDD
ncbi:MAG: hypothetical protein KQ78_01902 [Candidatus Izimaplasma bacterium HR2]|nr:MAG: hypothetical protein KQ78_01902 [Candidatus Izimaplasma bacterium HR2]